MGKAFDLVIYFAVFNLCCGMVAAFGVANGANGSWGNMTDNPFNNAGDPADFADRFDPDRQTNGINPDVATSLPFLATIYNAFGVLWTAITFVIAGFPQMLYSFGVLIPDIATRALYQTWIVGLITTIVYIIFAFFVYEQISGRTPSE